MISKTKNRLLYFVFILITLFLFLFSPIEAKADTQYVYLGGYVAGFSLKTKGVHIVGLNEVVGINGAESPSKEAGIMIGDIILEIDNKEICSLEDVEKVLGDKEIVKIKIDRNGEIKHFYVFPHEDVLGKKKLGIYVRNCINGIGTITYINQDKYAALGHPVLNENGKIVEISNGELFKAKITNIIMGEKGKAGELRGVILKDFCIGNANKNTNTGIYGKIEDNFIDKINLEKIEISQSEAKIGSAEIVCTIDDNLPQKYDIEIVKVDKESKTNYNFVIKITDKDLIKNTGGIIQGMSGSPIIQNGKLIGAVTHVFINDPTRGFGILINNMIK